MTILVSGAEPAELRKIGETSGLPEQYGCDFLLVTPDGFAGVQRKEVRDLVASVRGDRIARELGQATSLVRLVLVVEGDWGWNRTGESRAVPGFLRAQYDGFCLSVQHHGWWVLTSDSMAGTARLVRQVESWFQKASHTSLFQRPKSRGVWGTSTNRDWSVHLLQGFDGVGVDVAGNVYDHFGGVPLQWTCTEEELRKVDKVGKVRAKKMIEALARRVAPGQEDEG